MRQPFTDTMMERLVSRTLRIGVYASSIFMLAGFIASLFHPETLSTTVDHPSLAQLLALSRPDHEFFSRLFNPFLLFYLGILLLMLTPVLRIVMAIASFSLERDTRFVAVSVTVFLIILLSLYLSSVV
ncbi:MAG: DUF1634 domain-containing protein [Bacteroidota bacterium]